MNLGRLEQSEKRSRGISQGQELKKSPDREPRTRLHLAPGRFRHITGCATSDREAARAGHGRAHCDYDPRCDGLDSHWMTHRIPHAMLWLPWSAWRGSNEETRAAGCLASDLHAPTGRQSCSVGQPGFCSEAFHAVRCGDRRGPTSSPS